MTKRVRLRSVQVGTPTVREGLSSQEGVEWSRRRDQEVKIQPGRYRMQRECMPVVHHMHGISHIKRASSACSLSDKVLSCFCSTSVDQSFSTRPAGVGADSVPSRIFSIAMNGGRYRSKTLSTLFIISVTSYRK